MKEQIAKLRKARGVAVERMKGLLAAAGDSDLTEAQATEYDAAKAEVGTLDKQIQRALETQQLMAGEALRGGPTGGAEAEDEKNKFKSVGEQLGSVARAQLGHGTDPRLARSALGAGESDPSAGGFAVQTDFATSILTRAYEQGQFLSRTFRLTVGSNSNGIKIPGVDETSRATGSRWGGVQSYWVAEGNAPTASRPKFRIIELDLKKLASVWYMTDELLADAPALSQIADMAFSQEIAFMTEDAMFRGTGAGQPQGILAAPCKVKVSKETGQAAKTIVFENIQNMWARLWARSWNDAVWFINQDCLPQLNAMTMVVGTGGVPVYLPPGGLSQGPFGTLMGRPVIPVEYCETCGTEGDIVLCDWSQYILADKNGVQQATSMHVQFLTDQMAFRIIYRVDGEPTWHKDLTPYKGTNTVSPFVTLATRS